jgi:hypothetical protein
MIAKGKAIAHGGNALNYAMREGKMERIVGKDMLDSDTPSDILREMEAVNQHNYRCKNKYLRFEIGIAPQDRDKLAPDDMGRIAHEFARRMGLWNHQWIACTHKDTGKPHIHLIANRIGVDGKVFDTTFMSNRSARVAEEMSREMGLTIANEVNRQKVHQEAHADPGRQQVKERLQQIAYSELLHNDTLAGFLYGLDRRGVGIEPAKNKQGDTYGIRFSYAEHTFKASEIGREFGYHSLAGNFSSSPELEQGQSPQVRQPHGHDTIGHHHSHGDNSSKQPIPAKRRNKFAGKEDISRQATDNIMTGQIDKLGEVSNKTNEATTKLRESVEILAVKKIAVDTGPFEQLSRHFITQMELQLRKVKRPSKELVWYIVMWAITLVSAFLAGYYIQETHKWKEQSMYWYQLYEEGKEK